LGYRSARPFRPVGAPHMPDHSTIKPGKNEGFS
jgi:hypothetical protein